MTDQPRVTGIGGVFFRSKDPALTMEWYRTHLGLEAEGFGYNFFWRDKDDPKRIGRTVWGPFNADTEYFGDRGQPIMTNFRVNDLDGLLANLQKAGVKQVGGVDDYWYGRFTWIEDLEGNRVELWEPVDMSPEDYERRMKEHGE